MLDQSAHDNENKPDPIALTYEFAKVHGQKALMKFVIGVVNENCFYPRQYNRNASPMAIAFIAAAILKKPESELNAILKAFDDAAKQPGNGNEGGYNQKVLGEIIDAVEHEIIAFDDWQAENPPETTMDAA